MQTGRATKEKQAPSSERASSCWTVGQSQGEGSHHTEGQVAGGVEGEAQRGMEGTETGRGPEQRCGEEKEWREWRTPT